MSEDTPESDGSADDRPEHLEELPDGCGCAEVWDELSEQRERTEE